MAKSKGPKGPLPTPHPAFGKKVACKEEAEISSIQGLFSPLQEGERKQLFSKGS